ncbi:npp-10, partial [Pristionchus pacificus]
SRVSAAMFGGKPAFGASNTSFGTGTSLFGQNKPATSLFGQPQQQTQQTSLFGAKPAGTGLFGQSTTNNATTGTSLFGASTANTSGGLFGQSKPSLFGASTGSTTFGQTSTSLFGGTTGAAAGGTSMFGSTAVAAPNGTTVKFEPVIGQDTMQKNGTNSQISTKHMCITAMKQYESKCIEELRVEDYLAGRKAPAAGTTTGGGLFGSTATPATGGLFGSSTPQQKSIFGSTTAAAPAFGATAGSTSIFGSPSTAATTGTSLFGKPAGTSLFGATTGTTTGGLFGSPAAAPAATGSIFGQPAATSTFGQPAQTTSLFGASAASAAPSAFSFGAPATATATSGFGTTSVFGQPAASAAGTTSLFGAKPATTSAFSFGGGTTTTASPFGATATQPAGTGLFGAKPATLGAFGAPAATTGTGLFGAQPAAQTGTGLFGTTAAAQPTLGAFGAQPLQQQQPIVQQVAAAPIELVTNLNQAQMEMALINAQLGASPYGDSPLFKMREGQSKDSDDKPNPTSVQRQLKFLASKKDSPLANGGASGGLGGGAGGAAASAAAKSHLVSKVLDVSVGATPGGCRSPLTTKDLVYSPSVLPPTLGRGLRSGTPAAAMHNSSMLNHSRTERSMMKDGVDASIEASLRGNGANRLLAPQSARTNLKHLDASALNEVYSHAGSANRSALGGATSAAATTRDPDELPRREGSGNVLSPLQTGPADGLHARNATLHARHPPTLNLDVTSETVQSSPARSPSGQKENAVSPLAASTTTTTSMTSSSARSPRLSIGAVREVPGTGVRIAQPDYYTIPSIKAMRDMVRDGQVVLPDGLTVGRHTFGTVFWAGRLELTNVTLDEIIVFRSKEVTVYPDETIKPPLGQGFNRPAEITLERVWPVDRQTKEEVKDAVALVNMGWREKLEKTTLRMDADFKDFRPVTGSWVFRVKHFSKYGLPDDESEDEAEGGQSMKENLLHDRVQRAKVQLAAAAAGDGADAATGAAPAALPQRTSLTAAPSEDEVMVDEDTAAIRRAQQGIQALAGRFAATAAAGLGGDSSYLASPEARERAARGSRVTLGLDDILISLEGEGGEDGRMDDGDWRTTAVPDKKIKMETIDMEMYEESHRLRTQLLPRVHPRGRVTGTMTLTKREPVRAFEAHAPAAQSFRVPLKTRLIDETSAHGATSRVGWAAGGLSVQSLLPGMNAVAVGMRMFGHEYNQEYIADMFEHNQALSAVITRHRSSSNRAKHCELEEEAPSAPRIKPTSNYAQLIHSFAATASQSGRAKEALVWELCAALFPGDRPETVWEWDRREAVGAWARKALAAEPSSAFKSITGRGATVWKQLARGDLEGAITAAIGENLNVLASLLSVFTLDPEETMHDFKRQLDEWQRSGMLGKMPLPLAKCYVTMAGLTQLGQVNCLENLPWQAALGLCGLWYSRRAETLDACVSRVVAEAAAGRARLPSLDVHLELMRVAVDRTRSIERVLDAAIEASSAPNDFHLAWHVWAVTRAVGLPAMDECAEQALHVQYAEQLVTAAALPHAALFVLAHIKNAQCRNLAMREMIDRCALTRQPLDHGRALEWCRVPAEWIEWAKYLEAKMEGDVHAQCERALRAGELALAHRLYVDEVAPELLVTDQLEALDDLAQQFEESVDRMPAWGTGGQLYTHYIELKGLMNSEEESLDELLRLRDEICFRLKTDERCTPIQQIAMETIGREMTELGQKLRPETMDAVPLNTKSAPEIVDADISMMFE